MPIDVPSPDRIPMSQKASGDAALAHGLRGRPSNHRPDPALQRAVLDAYRRHQEAARRHSQFRQRRPAQSHGGTRALSLPGQQGHPVPHSRHQPAGIYRRLDLVGLHPHDQRGHHRSRKSGEAGRNRRRPRARSECLRTRKPTMRLLRLPLWRWRQVDLTVVEHLRMTLDGKGKRQ